MAIFKNTSIGLDISDSSIEVIELIKSGQKFKVKSSNRIVMPRGIVRNGQILDEVWLKEKIQKLFNEAKPSPIKIGEVTFGLPESQVYTRIFQLDKHNKKDREALILREAEMSIPLDKEDLLYSYYDFELAPEEGKEKTTEILLVAASKRVVIKWKKFFKSVGIDVEYFDIETLAGFRGMFQRTPSAPVCLVDLGAVRSTVSIFDKRGLQSTFSTLIAGNYLTTQIAEKEVIPFEDAENKKYNINISRAEDNISQIVTNSMQPLIREIKDFLIDFETRGRGAVKEIILIGGMSQMGGIVEFLSDMTGLPVRQGGISWINQKIPVVYIGAIGLALRDMQKKWGDRDPKFTIPDLKKISKEDRDIVPKVKSIQNREKVTSASKNDKFFDQNSKDKIKKLKKQKIILFLVLLLGAIIIGGLYVYREKAREERRIERDSSLISYSLTQSFDLKVPVAVLAKEYTEDRVRGRIIVDTIETSGSYEEALANSKRNAQKEIVEEEVLWDDPLDVFDNLDDVEFPVEFRWFIYNSETANQLFMNEVNKLNVNNVDFELNNILKNGIEKTDNPNIYYLKAEVTLSLNEMIEVTEEFSVEKDDGVKVEIIDNLNVRSDPDANSEKISQVSTGDEYELLDEVDGWVKIKIKDTLEGWVISEYVEKLDEQQ